MNTIGTYTGITLGLLPFIALGYWAYCWKVNK